MIKSKNIVNHVIDAHTEHPDLLIVDESTWQMIKSILCKRSTKIIFHLSNTCLLHVHNVFFHGLILSVNVKLSYLEKDWSQNIKMGFEIINGIIEKGGAI